MEKKRHRRRRCGNSLRESRKQNCAAGCRRLRDRVRCRPRRPAAPAETQTGVSPCRSRELGTSGGPRCWRWSLREAPALVTARKQARELAELLLCHGCCCRRRRRHRNQHRLRRCLRCCCHRRRRRRRCYSGCCWSSRGVGPPRAAPTCIMKRLPMAPGEGGTRGVISHSLTTRDPSQWVVKAAPQRLSQAAVPSTTHRKALPATLPITPSSGACTRPFRA